MSVESIPGKVHQGQRVWVERKQKKHFFKFWLGKQWLVSSEHECCVGGGRFANVLHTGKMRRMQVSSAAKSRDGRARQSNP